MGNEQNENEQQTKRQIIDELTEFNKIIKLSKTKAAITMGQLKRLIESNKRLWRLVYDGGSVAPMGIGVYGIEKDGSRFVLTADAVRGEVDISPDVRTKIYCFHGSSCQCREDLTAQLNAHVVAELDDGTMQRYWLQNVVISIVKRRKLIISNNIHGDGIRNNSHIDIVKGNGEIGVIRFVTYVKGNNEIGVTQGDAYYKYMMRDAIPLDRVELETWTYVNKGKIIVEFHANGRAYDEVTITPIVRCNGRPRHVPAVSAHIAIAPILVDNYTPLNLELAVGGVNFFCPVAILKRGRIGLGLRVYKNGAWTRPPSAWSVGGTTFEAVRARVMPQDVGSVAVEPGAPSLQPLW